MKNGLTLMEEQFCQLVALGKNNRDAYSEAFSIAITDKRREHSIDNKASRLSKRADILARITEVAGEQKRKNRKMWEERGETLAEKLYQRILEAYEDPDVGLLSRDALKGIEVLAKMKGMNAPDETVLKNGGIAENYTPRGVEAMSDEDLRAIIAREDRKIVDVNFKDNLDAHAEAQNENTTNNLITPDEA